MDDPPLDIIERVHNEIFIHDDPAAFYLITDVVEFSNGTKVNKNCGENFVNFIKQHKLGSVVQTRPKINPNSQNKIRAWIWSPNLKSLKTFGAQNKFVVPNDDYDDDYWNV